MVLASPVGNSSTSRILLVEGQDDRHLIWQICRKEPSLFSTTRVGHEFMTVTLLHQGTTFQIIEKGNRREVVNSIRSEVLKSDVEAVGILVDADASVTGCWNSITNGFARTGVTLPAGPTAGGTIISKSGDLPRIGIWMMPDNVSSGEVENFVLGMISTGDTVWPLSQNYIDRIPLTQRKFANTRTKIDKAKLHAWLAARKEPGRMGAAVGAADLSVNASQCQQFLKWITDLFG